MHTTRPLKRNIFTGLWHRTLPTLHSMSATTKSTPHPSILLYFIYFIFSNKSQPARLPLKRVQKDEP